MSSEKRSSGEQSASPECDAWGRIRIRVDSVPSRLHETVATGRNRRKTSMAQDGWRSGHGALPAAEITSEDRDGSPRLRAGTRLQETLHRTRNSSRAAGRWDGREPQNRGEAGRRDSRRQGGSERARNPQRDIRDAGRQDGSRGESGRQDGSERATSEGEGEEALTSGPPSTRMAHPANRFSKMVFREFGLGPYARSGPMRREVLKERAKNMNLQEEFLVYNDDDAATFVSLAVRNEQQIRFVCQVEEVLFALAESGICVAFDRHTSSRLCVLNHQIDEKITSIHWIPLTRSMVLLAHHERTRSTDIRCSSVHLDSIKAKTPMRRKRIFREAKISDPRNVELFPGSGKAIVISLDERDDRLKIIHIFSLEDYSLLKSIEVVDLRLFERSKNLLVLSYRRETNLFRKDRDGSLPVDILSVDTGDLIRGYSISLEEENEVKFIHLSGETLILGQSNMPLAMIDLKNRTSKTRWIRLRGSTITELLQEANLLLTISEDEISLFSPRGDLLTQLRFQPPWRLNKMAINREGNILVSHATAKRTAQGFTSGKITLTNIPKGDTIAEISESNTTVGLHQARHTSITKTVTQALSGVTCISYCDESAEVLSGNEDDLVHVWAD